MPSDRGRRSAGDKVAAEPANPLSEFLNPNSMITPGAAGAITMMITNTLCLQFADLPPSVTGLALSFLFGAIVFGYGASIGARLAYYVINSLIIFTVAMGSNFISKRTQDRLNGEVATEASATVGSRTVTDFSLAESTKPPATDANKPAQPPPKPPAKPRFFRDWL
jgi:hypothetical protein